MPRSANELMLCSFWMRLGEILRPLGTRRHTEETEPLGWRDRPTRLLHGSSRFLTHDHEAETWEYWTDDERVAAAGAGFLLCVLWFDLMFDVQALRAPAGELPEAVLASIAAYYARVTTAARPMNRLIALVMVATLAAIVVEIVRGDVRAGRLGLAGPRRGADRPGRGGHACRARFASAPGADPLARQSELARAIGRQHLLCLAGIAALLALQIASA